MDLSFSSIARVRAQARASLKNPSRPFTPRTTHRPLFQGSDYRPPGLVTEEEEEYKKEIPVDEIRIWTEWVDELSNSEISIEKCQEICVDRLETYILGLVKNVVEPDEDHGQEQLELTRHFEKCFHQQKQNEISIMIGLVALRLFATIIPARAFQFQSHVLTFCKELFFLSKDEDNDSYFCSTRSIEILLGLFTIDSKSKELIFTPEALIFAAGVLKNISCNSEEAQLILGRNGCISIINTVFESTLNHTRPTSILSAQLLIQLTAILRNLSLTKAHHKQFYSNEIIRQLAILLREYQQHEELMLNVSRILSKLTLHETARKQLAQCPDNLSYLLEVVDAHDTGQGQASETVTALLVRILFVLGNMTSSNDRNRKLITQAFDGLPILLNLLKQYSKNLNQSTSDLMIKLTRLIANLVLNQQAGERIAKSPVIQYLLGTLELVSTRLKSEELMLNTVSCITNITYYCSTDQVDDEQMDHLEMVASRLLPILLDPNIEAVIESARAFGNLSRTHMSRKTEPILYETLLVLLDHDDPDVVYTVLGVLMNIAMKPRGREQLAASDLVSKSIEIVRSAGLKYLSLNTMACKVLCNMSTAGFESKVAGRLESTLDELIHAVSDEDDNESRDFVQVAKVLCRKCKTDGGGLDLVPLDDVPQLANR